MFKIEYIYILGYIIITRPIIQEQLVLYVSIYKILVLFIFGIFIKLILKSYEDVSEGPKKRWVAVDAVSSGRKSAPVLFPLYLCALTERLYKITLLEKISIISIWSCRANKADFGVESLVIPCNR